MKRRDFLKFLGLLVITPKIVIDILEKRKSYYIKPDNFSSSKRWVKITGTINYNGLYMV